MIHREICRGGSPTRPGAQRRQLRLPHYDYALAGAYFITVCTHNCACIPGQIRNDVMHMNMFGHIVESCWNLLPDFYPRVSLDEFIVMPNHIHGVLILNSTKNPLAHTISHIVRAFKSMSARRLNESRGAMGVPVWQRSYYEHIVRSDDALTQIREYIVCNPAAWTRDRNNPSFKATASEDGAGRGPAPTKFAP